MDDRSIRPRIYVRRNEAQLIVGSFDPGEHLGYVIVRTNDKAFTIMSTGVITGYDHGMSFIAKEIMSEALDLIICEDYIINPRVYGHDHQGDSGLALRQIGALDLLSRLAQIDMILHMPTC